MRSVICLSINQPCYRRTHHVYVVITASFSAATPSLSIFGQCLKTFLFRLRIRSLGPSFLTFSGLALEVMLTNWVMSNRYDNDDDDDDDNNDLSQRF